MRQSMENVFDNKFFVDVKGVTARIQRHQLDQNAMLRDHKKCTFPSTWKKWKNENVSEKMEMYRIDF